MSHIRLPINIRYSILYSSCGNVKVQLPSKTKGEIYKILALYDAMWIWSFRKLPNIHITMDTKTLTICLSILDNSEFKIFEKKWMKQKKLVKKKYFAILYVQIRKIPNTGTSIYLLRLAGVMFMWVLAEQIGNTILLNPTAITCVPLVSIVKKQLIVLQGCGFKEVLMTTIDSRIIHKFNPIVHRYSNVYYRNEFILARVAPLWLLDFEDEDDYDIMDHPLKSNPRHIAADRWFEYNFKEIRKWINTIKADYKVVESKINVNETTNFPPANTSRYVSQTYTIASLVIPDQNVLTLFKLTFC